MSKDILEPIPSFIGDLLINYGNPTGIIGVGVYGKVFITDKNYVAKLSYFSEESDKHDVLNEIVYTSSISHPNIVKYYDVFFSVMKNGEMYSALVMDKYYKLDEIRDQLYGRRKENIAFQLIKTMAYLESRNIIHSDIKSDNLLYKMVTSPRGDVTFNIIVCDFGLAQGLECFNNEKSSKVASLDYQAPEIALAHIQSNRTIKYDSKVDVWAVGKFLVEFLYDDHLWSIPSVTDEKTLLYTMFELLGSPKDKTTNIGKYFDSLSPSPVDISARVKRYLFGGDKIIEDFIMKMLCFEPKDRADFIDLQHHEFFEYTDSNLETISSRSCYDKIKLFKRNFNFSRIPFIEKYMIDIYEMNILNEFSDSKTYSHFVQIVRQYLAVSKYSDDPLLLCTACLHIASVFAYDALTIPKLEFVFGDISIVSLNEMIDKVLYAINFDLMATGPWDILMSQLTNPNILHFGLINLIAPLSPELYNNEKLIKLIIKSVENYSRGLVNTENPKFIKLLIKINKVYSSSILNLITGDEWGKYYNYSIK